MLALAALLALGIGAARASAEPLSMTFTEARANVGVQLSDEQLFDVAPFAAQIDPGSGSITLGRLQVPDFSTFITDPLDADVTVEFEIGTITGSFDQATGALELSGTAGGTLTAHGSEGSQGTCAVSTTPAVLTLTTAWNSGGTSPRFGTRFTRGLTGAGAIAGQWTDMHAAPVTPDDVTVCNTVDERIGGPGGVWLQHRGDVAPPAAPLLIRTEPASPGLSGTPRILGVAEPGSAVSVYAGPSCGGAPVAAGGAAALSSPGLAVTVAEGVTATFSATATDAAGNASACSAPIAYTRSATPPPPDVDEGRACVVPKLVGKKLKRAKRALKAAGCKVGKVRKPKPRRLKRLTGKRRPVLVVKSSSPRRGARPADGRVDLKLGPKRRQARRSDRRRVTRSRALAPSPSSRARRRLAG